jgi:LAO/AO transport system kinase
MARTEAAEDTSALAKLRSGGKPAVAAALAEIERAPESAASLVLLDAAYARPIAHVIGLTGPPGVGKSTLAGALLRVLRASGRRVAVIAVDPSSRRSGGALLGDRSRIAADGEDAGVFVRSMAARDRLGGLAEESLAAMVLLRALHDVVILETVGVGQSETDVADCADTVVFCVQPGAGDSLQFMKAGIVEIPHIVAVTKSDMGAAASRARADVEGALGLTPTGECPVAVLSLSAAKGEGIEALRDVLDRRWTWLNDEGRLLRQRRMQARHWLADALRQRYGRLGARRAGAPTLAESESPFAKLAEVSKRLS